MNAIRRALEMGLLYVDGQTLEQIGEKYDLTRERVRQIIAKLGIVKSHGGMHIRSMHRKVKLKKAKAAYKDSKTMAIYGCDYATALSLNDGRSLSRPGTRTRRYVEQRRSAAGRGIAWEITFQEWLEVWEKSGKWIDRGRGKKKYVMTRIGDIGAYKVGNVKIRTQEENSREGIYQREDWKSKGISQSEMTPRQKKFWELHLSGHSAKKIADILGVRPAAAHQTITACKKKAALACT